MPNSVAVPVDLEGGYQFGATCSGSSTCSIEVVGTWGSALIRSRHARVPGTRSMYWRHRESAPNRPSSESQPVSCRSTLVTGLIFEENQIKARMR